MIVYFSIICVLVMLFIVVYHVFISFKRWTVLEKKLYDNGKGKCPASSTQPPDVAPNIQDLVVYVATYLYPSASHDKISCIVTHALPLVKAEANSGGITKVDVLQNIARKQVEAIVSQKVCDVGDKSVRENSKDWTQAPICSQDFHATNQGNYIDPDGLWWGWDSAMQRRCAYRPNPKCGNVSPEMCVSHPPSPAASPSPSPDEKECGDLYTEMLAGESLLEEEELSSKSGRYAMVLHKDGRLVVLDHKTDETMWSSIPNDTTREIGVQFGPYKLVLHEDGNLVAYSNHASRYNDQSDRGRLFGVSPFVWMSDSADMGVKPYKLFVTDDGSAVIRDSRDVTVWSSTGWFRTCTEASRLYSEEHGIEKPWQAFREGLDKGPSTKRVWRGPPCRDCDQAERVYFIMYPDAVAFEMSAGEHYRAYGKGRKWTGDCDLSPARSPAPMPPPCPTLNADEPAASPSPASTTSPPTSPPTSLPPSLPSPPPLEQQNCPAALPPPSDARPPIAPPPVYVTIKNVLVDGETLRQGEKLASQDKRFELTITARGDMILENNGTKVWSRYNDSTRDFGAGPYRLVMQKDGNVVLYNCDNEWLWQTDSSGKGVAGFSLEVTNDGELVLYDSKGTVLWNNTWQNRTCEQAKSAYTKMYPDVNAFNASSWDHYRVTVLERPGVAKEAREWTGPKCSDCRTSSLMYSMYHPETSAADAVNSYIQEGSASGKLWWGQGTPEECLQSALPPPACMPPAPVRSPAASYTP